MLADGDGGGARILRPEGSRDRFNLPLRQSEGCLASLFRMMDIDRSAPDLRAWTPKGQVAEVLLACNTALNPQDALLTAASRELQLAGLWHAAKWMTIGATTPSVKPMHAWWAVHTDPGLRRSRNEDSSCARRELGLFVVADGMGGHAAGEVASQLAVDAIKNVVEDTRALGPQDTWPITLDPAIGRDGNRLRAGFDLANRQIADRVASTAALRGMATTAVAVLVAEATTALAHVGDSRAYLYRDDELSRLTRDHSWVEEQMQAGMLSEAAAREHPWRHMVTCALNGGKGLAVEVAEPKLREGDRLLLCSDGLSSVLTDTEIGRVLSTNADRQAICDELVRRVIAGGAPDNVTTLVLDIDAG